MSGFVIAADIGGTNIRVALLNGKLEVINKETANTADYNTSEEFFAKLGEMVRLVDPEKKADSIGMALPSPWIGDEKTITDITNIPCLEGMKTREAAEYFPGYRLCIENDVNVIALLESRHGASRGYKNSLYVTVSTGISGGIIINNDIYRGAHGYAGEIGSVILERAGNGQPLKTLEGECSGLALDKKSRELFGEDSNARELFEKYRADSPEVFSVMEDWIEDMTNGIASVIQTVDPEIIVLGGSVVLMNPWVSELLERKIRDKVLGNLASEICFVNAEYGLDAGLIGAGYFALKQMVD